MTATLLQMPVRRPVVQAHTLEQWFALTDAERSLILKNIKLKDRLYRYLLAKRERRMKPTDQPKLVPCRKCEGAGKVLIEPRYPGIHPSQLPHPCLLKLYKELIGAEGRERFEPRTLLIFDLGSLIHDMFQGYGLDGAWGPVYRREAKVNADLQVLAELLMLEGSADADNILTIDDIPDHPVVYEVGLVHEYKSINRNGFEKLTRPKPDHKTQAMLYSAALNRPIVVYLYMDKDTQNLQDYPVPFEPELWKNIEAKARLLVQHYDTQQPPSATVGYHCQDCAYAHGCVPYSSEVQRKRRA